MKYYLLTLLSTFLLAIGVVGCKSGGAPDGPASAPASAPAAEAEHAHGEGHHEHPAEAAAADAPSVFDAAPAVGTTAKCPVSGEVFTVEADTDHVEYEGKHYVFCCEHCVEKFNADPAKFVSK